MTTLDNAKSLRINQTEAEQKLWYYLRAHRFMGVKLKRQKPIGKYVVDFICVEQKLIIEVDGGQHAENIAYDQNRDSWLRAQGYRVLRFWNNQLMHEIENVLEQIRLALAVTETLSPGPSPVNGRGEII